MNNLRNFSVLYVEDDPNTLRSIEDILSRRVKKLYIATNGKEALKVFIKEKPDIVITDINMPKMNGLDLSLEIKKISSETPIAILTAFNENALLHRSVEIGIDAYITKPVVNIAKLEIPLGKIAAQLQGKIDAEKLQHMLEIQTKTAAVGEMLKNIAHQWRQPLSIINMAVNNVKVSVALDEPITSESFDKMTDDILRQTQYLSDTIQDFTNFFKDDGGRKSQFNLKKTVSKLSDLFIASYQSSSINYLHDTSDSILYANENLLIQSLLNIFNNAKDAMLIKKINSDKRFVFFHIEEKNENLIITIKDSAGGIDQEIIDKIFEPYFTTKDKSLGTGIGLYMTQSIITKHFQGYIKVENTHYTYQGHTLQGAIFTITIPLIGEER